MSYLLHTIWQGLGYIGHDPNLGGLVKRTLQLTLISTAIASLIGFPIACVIGLGRSRVSGAGIVAANAGLGLPPIAVGVYLVIGLDGQWYDMKGMILAQTILSMPIIIALAASAIRRLPSGLLDQAQAYGASGWRLAVFALREAKVGAVTAIVVALAAATAEVGAITLVGGAATTQTTLASQIIQDVSLNFDGAQHAVAHLTVLIGLMLCFGAILTLVQQVDARRIWLARGRASTADAAGGVPAVPDTDRRARE